MIYYDPTEARKGTRLQQEVINVGKPLKHLEMLTGADLLVTPYEKSIEIPDSLANDINENALHIIGAYREPPTDVSKRTGIPLPAILSTKRFFDACRTGILIQRKSGMDFTASIPKLHEILGRMLLWTPDPWLLIAANIGCNKDGKAVIDGKTSAFTHKTVVSAKMSWMLSGGKVIEISRDNLTGHVIEYAERKLKQLAIDNQKFVVRKRWAKQNVVGPNDPRWEWMNVLMNLQGIGQKRAKALADYSGNLVNALVFLSDTDAVVKLGRNDIARKSDSVKFRKMLGIDDGNILAEIGILGKDNE